LVKNDSVDGNLEFRNFRIVGLKYYGAFDFPGLNALGIQPDRVLPTIALGSLFGLNLQNREGCESIRTVSSTRV